MRSPPEDVVPHLRKFLARIRRRPAGATSPRKSWSRSSKPARAQQDAGRDGAGQPLPVHPRRHRPGRGSEASDGPARCSASSRRRLGALPEWRATAVHEVVQGLAAERQLGLGKVAQPLRVAVSGGTVSPPIDQTLELLGRDETLARLAVVVP
ncbi:MAG: hypothetical protein R3E65_06085 [Steroidobacteraceae bacterium]